MAGRSNECLTVVGASNSLCNGWADVNHTELGALPNVSSTQTFKTTQTHPLNLVAQRNGVGDDQRGQDATVERLNSISRQDSVSDQRQNRVGSVLLQDCRCLDESS